MTDFKELFKTVAEYNELENMLNSREDKLEMGDTRGLKYKIAGGRILAYKPKKEELEQFISELQQYCANEPKDLPFIFDSYKQNYDSKDFIIFIHEVYKKMNSN